MYIIYTCMYIIYTVCLYWFIALYILWNIRSPNWYTNTSLLWNTTSPTSWTYSNKQFHLFKKNMFPENIWVWPISNVQVFWEFWGSFVNFKNRQTTHGSWDLQVPVMPWLKRLLYKSFPETNSSPLRIGGWETILSLWVLAHFQGLLLLLWGRVTVFFLNVKLPFLATSKIPFWKNSTVFFLSFSTNKTTLVGCLRLTSRQGWATG